MRLAAGVARATITPPVGCALSGYRDRGPATGVLDDLYATALVLEDGMTCVALVSLDLIGLYGETIVPELKGTIQAAAGIPPEHVVLACTHTHAGPVVAADGDMPGGDTAVAMKYRQSLARRVAGVVAVAAEATQPATVWIGKAEARIGVNRREVQADGIVRLGSNPGGPIDPEVQVWRFDGEDGEVLALVAIHGCHPSTLGSGERRLSADFPGAMRRVVERALDAKVLYLQGAAGDVDPAVRDVERTGEELAVAVLPAASEAERLRAAPLRLARETVLYPGLIAPDLDEARDRVRQLEEAPACSEGERWWRDIRLERDRRALAALENGRPYTVSSEISVLRLGEAAIAFNSAEAFCELGLEIKRRSPLPHTAVAGYTDGALWYLPTPAAYDEGGYELEACRVAPEAADLLVATTERLLRR